MVKLFYRLFLYLEREIYMLKTNIAVVLISSVVIFGGVEAAFAQISNNRILVRAECAAYGPKAGSYIQCQGEVIGHPWISFFGSNGSRLITDHMKQPKLAGRACQEIVNSNLRLNVVAGVKRMAIVKTTFFDGTKAVSPSGEMYLVPSQVHHTI